MTKKTGGKLVKMMNNKFIKDVLVTAEIDSGYSIIEYFETDEKLKDIVTVLIKATLKTQRIKTNFVN